MAKQAGNNADAKRIIQHMNNDHHDSIVRYLEYYKKLSSWKAYDGELSDITLDEMTITCAGEDYTIPFDPAMNSFRDARERVVEMDSQCIKGLGRSDITIKEFIPARGIYAIEFLVVASTFLGFSNRGWFENGQVIHRYLGSSFARFCWTTQPYLFLFMVVFHAMEVVYFERTRLRKHSVNPKSMVYWKWIMTVYIEGVFAQKRFRDLVEQKKAARPKEH